MKPGNHEAQGEAGPRYAVPALEKGLDILELLARATAPMTLTAIATGLGRSTGEIYRILQYLERRDYIVRDRDRDSYALSLQLFHLAHDQPPLRALMADAVPEMEALVLAAGQSCHLAVLNRTNITVVAQIDSPLAIRYSVRLGAQFPAWETSSGILLCACLDADGRRALFQKLALLIDDVAMDDLRTKIDEVEARGFEQRSSLRIAGITNISFPVRSSSGAAIAALTVPYLPHRMNYATLDEVSAMAGAAAERISVAQGYRTATQAAVTA